MSDPLLKIKNNHSLSCGDPPIVNSDISNRYIGYFENAFGEQWIFTMDRETGRADLYGGDVGWNTKLEVIDGNVADVILGSAEQLWLTACWIAANKQLPSV